MVDKIGKTPELATYKCDQCPFSCTWKRGLQQHSVVHLDKSLWQFKCNLCNYVSKRKINLDEHTITNHSEEKPFKCSVAACDYRTKHSRHLKSHYRVVHDGSKPFHCNFDGCGYRTKTKSCLTAHMNAMHSAREQDKVCPLCDKKFHRTDMLRLHMKVHTGEKPFSCSECNYRAATKGGLNRHSVIHKDEKPFACSYPDCDFTCKLNQNLKNHERRHDKSLGQQFKCPLCPKSFGERYVLKLHTACHTAEKAFECKYCDYKTNRRACLNRHEATFHNANVQEDGEAKTKAVTRANLAALRVIVGASAPTLPLTGRGDKPFGCDKCEFRAVSRNKLNHHASVHSEERPFPCTFEGCAHRAKTQGHLKVHFKTHESKRRREFHCPLCSMKFLNVNGLHRHINTHTGERRFKCVLCDFTAKTGYNLDSHLASVHKDEIK